MNRKIQQFKAIVFDFDGTLAKLNIDFPLMKREVLELTAGYGVPTGALQGLFILEMIAAGKILVSQLCPGKEEEYVQRTDERIREIEIAAARSGGLFEGTREFLQELNNRGIRIGIISRNCRQAVAEAFPDIENYTSAVLTREMTRHVKPHPEHLRATLRKLNTAPEHTTMVGDHPMDIRMGKELFLYTVGVLSGHSCRRELEEAGADLIIDRAADVTGYVRETGTSTT